MPMLMVAWRLITSGERGVSLLGSKFSKLCGLNAPDRAASAISNQTRAYGCLAKTVLHRRALKSRLNICKITAAQKGDQGRK